MALYYAKLNSRFLYQLDGGGWKQVEQNPELLANHLLLSESSPKLHKVKLRIPAHDRPIAIDGFLVLNPLGTGKESEVQQR